MSCVYVKLITYITIFFSPNLSHAKSTQRNSVIHFAQEQTDEFAKCFFFPQTWYKIAQKIMFTLQSYLNFKLFLTTACYGNAYFFRFGWASWIFHINLCVSWDSNLIFDHFKIKIDNDVQNNSKISYSVAKKFSTFLIGSNFISMKKTATEKISAKVRFIFKIQKPLNLFQHNY